MGWTLGRMAESPRDRTLSPAPQLSDLDAASMVVFLTCSSSHSPAPGLPAGPVPSGRKPGCSASWPSALRAMTPCPPPSPFACPHPGSLTPHAASQTLFCKLRLFCEENSQSLCHNGRQGFPFSFKPTASILKESPLFRDCGLSEKGAGRGKGALPFGFPVLFL